MRDRLQPLFLLTLLSAGYLGVLNTWWFHDDWVFLADALGIAARPNQPVRILGYQAYWSLMVSLFGTSTWPYGLSRILIHVLTGAAVLRLSERLGFSRDRALVAAMAYVAAPIAFESLYWGTGAIELLGTLFTVLAVEKWFVGTHRSRLLACLMAAASIACKESGLFLPFFFAAVLIRRKQMRSRLFGIVCVVAAYAVLEARWVAGDVSPVATYTMNPAGIPASLAALGGLLVAPLPLQTTDWMAGGLVKSVGALLWIVWFGVGVRESRHGRPLLLACAAWALASLLPAATASGHLLPRYALAGLAPLLLAAASLVLPTTFRLDGRRAVVSAVLLAGLAWTTVAYHENARDVHGKPFNRLVLKEQFSRAACVGIGRIIEPGDRSVLFRVSAATLPAELTLLQEAVHKDLALRVLYGRDLDVLWVNGDVQGVKNALIIDVDGMNMKYGGRR